MTGEEVAVVGRTDRAPQRHGHPGTNRRVL